MRALSHHPLAKWIQENNTQVHYVRPHLYLLRSAECGLTLEQWARFSRSFCAALAQREESADGFVIYGTDPAIVHALEGAVQGTHRLWVIVMVQSASYFEATTPRFSTSYVHFTRFTLVHGTGPNGVFEFAAFATCTNPAMAMVSQIDHMYHALQDMESRVLDLCKEANTLFSFL